MRFKDRTVRELKGVGANEYVTDYCVFDLETTGLDMETLSIVEISALKVRDSKVVSEFSTLVNPKCHIPEEVSEINNITDEMVANSPFIEDVIDDFLDFIGEDIVVGYNHSNFDINIIYDITKKMNKKIFSNNYIDVFYAVMRSLRELDNLKLSTVSEYYHFNTDGAHRALTDCYLTKFCYDRIYEEFGNEAFVRRRNRSNRNNGFKVEYSEETIALRKMKEELEYFYSFNQIQFEDAKILRGWMDEYDSFSDKYPFNKIFESLDNVLSDGFLTLKESNFLKTIFEEVVNPVKSFKDKNENNSFENKHICLTGEFLNKSRKEIEDLVLSIGGTIDKSVKKTTDIIIVGTNGSKNWITGNYGAKIKRAMELNEKGANIQIMEEETFMTCIN